MMPILRKFKQQMGFLGIMIVIRQGLLVYAQYLNAETFNFLLAKNWNGFFGVILQITLTWAIIIALDRYKVVYEMKVAQDIGIAIRMDIASHIVNSSYATLKKDSHAKYLSWLNNDIETIINNGFYKLLDLFSGVMGVLFAGYAMVYYHWSLLVLTLLGFLIILYVPKIFDKSIYQSGKEVTEANETFLSNLEENLKGYPTFFTFQKLNVFTKKILEISTIYKKVLVKREQFMANVRVVNFSINVIFQILLTFVAGVGYLAGYTEIGAAAAVGALADIIFSGLGEISNQVTEIKSIAPIFDKHNTLQNTLFKPVELSATNEIFKLNHVSLSFGEQAIFRDMNMTIMVNKKYLIKGRSGAGKSSIFNLMLGYLKPDNGTVEFMGHDVSQLSSKTIANEVIYLVQEPFIFSGTIQDNLQMGDDYPKTQLIGVLDRVGFENPSDWLTRDVGNQGSELSGGQKQRIAIARALLRQPKVLLLDEVTSALDKESAINIEQRLLTMNNVTIVVISHVLHQEVQPFYDGIYDIA